MILSCVKYSTDYYEITSRHEKDAIMFNNKNCANQKILLRTDLNVPLFNGAIVDDYRLEVALPTINLLIKQQATIILLTHLGRPRKKDPLLSTKHLIPWFRNKGYSIQFIPDLTQADEILSRSNATLFLMENLRFYSGEQSTNLKRRYEFAKKLFRLGRLYVNDAFAVLHRNECSTIELPLLFPPNQRALGLLVKKELITLHQICATPKRPFLFIFGGNKLNSKIDSLYTLIKKIDVMALCPAVVFTFLKAENKSIGTSCAETDMRTEIAKLIHKAHIFNTQIIFPIDYLASRQNKFKGPLEIVTHKELKGTFFGITVGPETVTMYGNLINNSGTILYNGLTGSLEHPETLTSIRSIFEAMAYSPGKTIVAGGDSVAAIRRFNFTDKINCISAGGGATIAYISGQQLPGLTPFAHELTSLLKNRTEAEKTDPI